VRKDEEGEEEEGRSRQWGKENVCETERKMRTGEEREVGEEE